MTLSSKMGTLPEDIDRDILGATSILVQKANEIRQQKINWPPYLQSKMISQDDYDVIVSVEVPGKGREGLLSGQRYIVARTFINMLSHISKDQTIQYILTIVDDILSEDKSRVAIFQEYSKKHKESMWSPFLNLLTRPDAFIVNMTSRIIAKLACWSREPMKGSDLTYYLTWLKDQLRAPSNEYLRSVGRCLQMMLRVEEYREVFYQLDGVVTIVQVLGSGKHNFQIQYQLTFCLWVMTFNQAIAEKMNNNENEKQDSSLSKKEFCELKRENILKMRLEGLEGPLHKRVKLVESELAMEKSKKLMQELRRIQKEKASDDSMMILDSKPREERVNKEIGAGFGSKIVLDVEIMTLKNINYHLEKEIASLKEHVSHYKRKADEWKTRYYKEILMVNSKVNPSEVKDNTDEKNEPKQSSDLTTTRSATKQQTTDLQIDGNVTVMSAKDENRDFENHNATKNVHQVEANPVQTLPHKEKNYRPQTTIGVGKENQRSKYKKSKLSNVDDNNDCKTQ